ncbi:MAG: hypothetical protein LBQ04_01895 [Endomicrobium sp.]|jgi:hypothetical protein|nr:hypothetical protein [Endomicrobium sp.]
MGWFGGVATYTGYRLVATGFGGLGAAIVNGIGHCGTGILNVAYLLQLPYVSIPGLILGGILLVWITMLTLQCLTP